MMIIMMMIMIMRNKRTSHSPPFQPKFVQIWLKPVGETGADLVFEGMGYRPRPICMHGKHSQLYIPTKINLVQTVTLPHPSTPSTAATAQDNEAHLGIKFITLQTNLATRTCIRTLIDHMVAHH